MFIHREEYYNSDTERKKEADIIIAKQRMGKTGKIAMFFDGGYDKFASLYKPNIN